MKRPARHSHQGKNRGDAQRPAGASGPGFVRIIGGVWRGRKLPYGGEGGTRPMKDRVREAVFNLLRGVVEGTHVVDLFAGTGALGFEALSQGAHDATLCECNAAIAGQLRRNAEELAAADRARIISGDAFHCFPREAPDQTRPWLVFCSPPYEYYESKLQALAHLMHGLFDAAPDGSWFVVESDDRFDPTSWTWGAWDVRHYPPATIAIAGREL